ncbi:GDP-mannose 4,6-dehydratase [Vibrio lentus]
MIIHISTDEVFGDLANHAPAFDGHSLNKPSSQYSTSKASSDHIVKLGTGHTVCQRPSPIAHRTNTREVGGNLLHWWFM